MEAAKTILTFVTNPRYLVSIREAASRLSAVVSEVTTVDHASEQIQSIHPSLLILDLSNRPVNWENIVALARQHQIPVLAYGPHTEEEVQRAAAEAGCNEVLTNSKFTMELPSLLNKYLS